MAIIPQKRPQRGIVQRLGEMFDNRVKEPIQEIIGRVSYYAKRFYYTRISVDHTQTDYSY
jgi:hypothetical protein